MFSGVKLESKTREISLRLFSRKIKAKGCEKRQQIGFVKFMFGSDEKEFTLGDRAARKHALLGMKMEDCPGKM